MPMRQPPPPLPTHRMVNVAPAPAFASSTPFAPPTGPPPPQIAQPMGANNMQFAQPMGANNMQRGAIQQPMGQNPMGQNPMGAPQPDPAWTRGGAPMVCDLNNSSGMSFPLAAMKVTIDVHMSSMFVKMEGTWTTQIAGAQTTALFKLPTSQNGTITSCGVAVGSRLFRTAVIAQEATQEFAGKGPSMGASQSGQEQQQNNLGKLGEYDPTCFRLPIPGVRPGEQISITVQYFETLDYVEGSYDISVPLAFGSNLGMGPPIEQLLDVSCTINAGAPNCKLGECSYPVTIAPTRGGGAGSGVVSLVADKSQRWEASKEFKLQYRVETAEILSTLLHDDNSQSFSLNVAPPPPSALKGAQVRPLRQSSLRE